MVTKGNGDFHTSHTANHELLTSFILVSTLFTLSQCSSHIYRERTKSKLEQNRMETSNEGEDVNIFCQEQEFRRTYLLLNNFKKNNPSITKSLKDAMKEIESKTCIRWQEIHGRTLALSPFVFDDDGEKSGCWANKCCLNLQLIMDESVDETHAFLSRQLSSKLTDCKVRKFQKRPTVRRKRFSWTIEGWNRCSWITLESARWQ